MGDGFGEVGDVGPGASAEAFTCGAWVGGGGVARGVGMGLVSTRTREGRKGMGVEKGGRDALRRKLVCPMLFHSPTVFGAGWFGLTLRSGCMRSTVP